MSLSQPTLSEIPGATPPPSADDRDGDSRLNVRLSPEVRQALDWIANQRGVTAVEAVRRSIGTEKFFQELILQGAKILVQMPGEKHVKEVVFTR
jgi:hypothetical protein